MDVALALLEVAVCDAAAAAVDARRTTEMVHPARQGMHLDHGIQRCLLADVDFGTTRDGEHVRKLITDSLLNNGVCAMINRSQDCTLLMQHIQRVSDIGRYIWSCPVASKYRPTHSML